ncbi:MAG: hypothetical protein KME13_01075 [Myxacorys californica WJT36-NPBG1]|jgi:hypothetical protein|nr:hypothetical protein [Myxacorys californica WJT36-NPBG1]
MNQQFGALRVNLPDYSCDRSTDENLLNFVVSSELHFALIVGKSLLPALISKPYDQQP